MGQVKNVSYNVSISSLNSVLELEIFFSGGGVGSFTFEKKELHKMNCRLKYFIIEKKFELLGHYLTQIYFLLLFEETVFFWQSGIKMSIEKLTNLINKKEF